LKLFIEKYFGLAVIVTLCLSAGAWFNIDRHKSEPLTPTTSNAPKVGSEVGSKSIVLTSPSPLGVDESNPKQTEEEVMASIVRNACLQRCPSGTVPVFIGDEIVGFFDHVSARMTDFTLGERLNL
tara:strand:+ start:484 stop:858 length:375 start_codon:yes stop_codon:yes gene_type:complete